MNQLTFLWAELPANPSRSPDFARDLLTLAETSCLPTAQLLHDIAPSGWSGRTSPASCHLTADGILEPSSGCWGNSGMGSPTGFLTLNTSEWPKDAAVCSLSDTLEAGPVPPRFFLSAKACQGILRRAEKRGKLLPHGLRIALERLTLPSEKSRDLKTSTSTEAQRTSSRWPLVGRTAQAKATAQATM